MITHNKDYTKYSIRCKYVEHKPKDKKRLHTAYKEDKIQKDSIYNWINHYKFTHFITLRLQKHNEREDLRKSEQQLEKYMKLFEKKMIGRRWSNKHVFFIAFAERGVGSYYHFHILLRLDGFGIERVIKALEAVEIQMKLSQYSICIDPINHLPQVVTKYSTKEVRFNQNYIGDTSAILPSTYLFNLPYEKTYHYQLEEFEKKIITSINQQANVTEEVLPNKTIPMIQTKANSVFIAPQNYIS